MKFAARNQLLRVFLRRDRYGWVSTVFGIVVGVASLVFFTGLGLGLGRTVTERLFPYDSRLVEVAPPQVRLGAALGAGVLDDAAVERLRAIPHVAHAFRKMNIRVPSVSRYDGDFFGQHLRVGFEVLPVGVDPEFVAADVPAARFHPVGEGDALPVVVSSRLIDIYNATFAPARGLPRLAPSMILGFVFPVEFNRSFVVATAGGPTRATRMEVAAVSPRGTLAGVLIPLEVAKSLNASFGTDAATYSQVVLEARDSGDVPAISAAVREMGFRIEDQERRLSENIGAAVALTTLALGFLSLLVCVLAAFNIAHALSERVRARVKEFGLFRALGASRRDVASLVLWEGAWLGLLGGVVSLGMARLLALGVDAVAQRVLPPLTFSVTTFFEFPLWLLAGGLGLGVFFAVAGAFVPARNAAKIDPARTLAG